MSKKCPPCITDKFTKLTVQLNVSSFLLQILHTLQMMQNCSKYKKGASIDEISRHMKEYFKLNGDVISQVETSVLQATRHGFLQENGRKYILIGAVAKTQLCPNQAIRKKMANDILKVFMHKSNYKAPKQKARECDSDSDDSSGDEKDKNLEYIIKNQSDNLIDALEKLQQVFQSKSLKKKRSKSCVSKKSKSLCRKKSRSKSRCSCDTKPSNLKKSKLDINKTYCPSTYKADECTSNLQINKFQNLCKKFSESNKCNRKLRSRRSFPKKLCKIEKRRNSIRRCRK